MNEPPEGSRGGADGTDSAAALRAERDALARRAADAERRVTDLEAQLTEARAQLHQDRAQQPGDGDGLSIFEGDGNTGSPVAGDGSDTRALPLILGATAIVAAMVTVLAFLNDTLFSWFGIAMLVITAGLTYAAAATRVQPVTVHLNRGILYIEQGDAKYRFDLNHEATRIEQRGRPGDSDWRITFARRHTGPFSVDATMVDPDSFTAQVRQYRSSI